MDSIEERANRLRRGSTDAYSLGIRKAYVLGATEQDPISRADERHKVIGEACKLVDYMFSDYPFVTTAHQREIIVDAFRKAMGGCDIVKQTNFDMKETNFDILFAGDGCMVVEDGNRHVFEVAKGNSMCNFVGYYIVENALALESEDVEVHIEVRKKGEKR